jgi:NADH-quinone oxidoreductase subunit H
MDIIESKTWVEWVITIAKFGFCFVPVLYILLLIPMERRGAGFMQDRQGPNRSYIKVPFFGKVRLFGYVQNMCDGTKLFFKEMFAPSGSKKFLYYVAPAIPFAIVFLSPCVIPWFGPMVFEWGGKVVRIAGPIVDSEVGILLLFGFSSLSAYGAVLAGLSSRSKYSYLGSLRTTAMTISYEVCQGLSMMGLLVLAGSFSLTDIVSWQEHHVWGIVAQPVAFFCFLIATIAETGRATTPNTVLCSLACSTWANTRTFALAAFWWQRSSWVATRFRLSLQKRFKLTWVARLPFSAGCSRSSVLLSSI